MQTVGQCPLRAGAGLFVLALALLAWPAAAEAGAGAGGGPAVTLNGRPLQLADPVVIENGRTLAPLRPIAEVLGIQVTWQAATGQVVCQRDGLAVALRPGEGTASVGSRSVALDAPARIIGGRTYVPLRFLGEALGVAVSWDGATGTVGITAPNVVDQAAVQQLLGALAAAAPLREYDLSLDIQGAFFTPENRTTLVQFTGTAQMRGADRLTYAEARSEGERGTVEWYHGFAARRGEYFVQKLPGDSWLRDREADEDPLGETAAAVMAAVQAVLGPEDAAGRADYLRGALRAARLGQDGALVQLQFLPQVFDRVRDMELRWVGGPVGFPGLEAVHLATEPDGPERLFRLWVQGTDTNQQPYQLTYEVRLKARQEPIAFPALPRASRRG